MIQNIDHIAIKTDRLSPVCRALENLGFSCNSIEEHDEVGMRIAFLGNRETSIELLEVTDPASPIAQDKPGLHHLGLKVHNIEEIYRQMSKSNRYQLQGEIRKGAHSRIFFFKISGQENMLFECVE